MVKEAKLIPSDSFKVRKINASKLFKVYRDYYKEALAEDEYREIQS